MTGGDLPGGRQTARRREAERPPAVARLLIQRSFSRCSEIKNYDG